MTWLAVWVGVMPVVYHYQQGTLRVMTLAAVEHLDGGELATLNIHAPSTAFTARRSFTRYTAQTDDLAMRLRLTKRFQRPEPLLLIALERRVGPLLDDARPYLWAQRYGWQLLSNRPAPPGFVLPPSPWREADLRRRGR
ncbi:MAG: hypothetical protein HUU35_14620 [Armatimonadetes bacterium]|nr:hypothetical protein [Armatimonadota bacterium]